MTPTGHCRTHFGFERAPFEAAPDQTCIYWSAAHRRAFSILEFALGSSAPFSVLSGPVGSGKSLLAQALLARHRAGADLTLVQAMPLAGQGILDALALSLGEGDAALKTDFVRLTLNGGGRLAHAAPRVVLIDEAQGLSAEDAEQLRLLANVQSGEHALWRFVLIGQGEIDRLLQDAALAQRVAVRARLTALNAEETHSYIRFRLRQAGGSADEFTPEALRLVHEMAEGIPRRINQICDLALTLAAINQAQKVGVGLLRDIEAEGMVIEVRPLQRAAEALSQGVR